MPIASPIRKTAVECPIPGLFLSDGPEKYTSRVRQAAGKGQDLCFVRGRILQGLKPPHCFHTFLARLKPPQRRRPVAGDPTVSFPVGRRSRWTTDTKPLSISDVMCFSAACLSRLGIRLLVFILLAAFAIPARAQSPVVLDTVVAAVNRHLILSSDIDEEIRLSVLDPGRAGSERPPH